MKPDLIRRHDATSATLAKYKGKLFDWRAGNTCAHLMRFHLKKLGHAMPPMPPMRSAIGARRALSERGCGDMGDILGLHLQLPEIAPAAMLLGDLAAMAGEDGLGGVMVCAGPHKLFGWYQDHDRLVMLDLEFDQVGRAFRV